MIDHNSSLHEVLLSVVKTDSIDLSSVNPKILYKALISLAKTSDAKEQMASIHCGFENSEGMHGYDAFDPTLKHPNPLYDGFGWPVEQKSEIPQGQEGLLCGKASWGKKLEESVLKIIDDDPILSFSGYDSEGKLIYILKFLLSDCPEFQKWMLENTVLGKGIQSQSAKSSWNHWRNAKNVSLEYIRMDYYIQLSMTGPFYKFLCNLYYQQEGKYLDGVLREEHSNKYAM